MKTIDISLFGLATLPVAVALIILISHLAGLKLERRIFTAFARMALQLSLVGIYLKFIFRINSPMVNIAWIVIMIVIANLNILHNAGLNSRRLFLSGFGALCAAMLITVAWFIMAVVSPKPIYDARYLIPISGMVLGNCLRANIVTLEKFFSSITENEKTYLAYLTMGATVNEATRPYSREAVKVAMAPGISSVAAMGLISLPGMITGQILGGALPMTAIKYQIAIMVAIFLASIISSILNILLTLKVAFNENGILKKDIILRT